MAFLEAGPRLLKRVLLSCLPTGGFLDHCQPHVGRPKWVLICDIWMPSLQKPKNPYLQQHRVTSMRAVGIFKLLRGKAGSFVRQEKGLCFVKHVAVCDATDPTDY